MRITRVAIDLDDVCNEFTMHALKHVGCDIDFDDWSNFNPEWGFDIIHAANALPHRLDGMLDYGISGSIVPEDRKERFTFSSFWSRFDCKFWADLPISKELQTILEIASDITREESVPFILTAPICGPLVPDEITIDCMTGKIRWMHKHLPDYMVDNFLIGKPKYFCATKETLLIDDSDENVNLFRKAGGQAVLLPRPWNSAHDANPIDYLVNKIMKILT